MAEFIRQYLCCCLPQPAPTHDTERQPLLDPDVLPQAPPRAPPTQTTEEQEAEQNLRRKILDQASERLINIFSPNPFTSSSTSTSTSSALGGAAAVLSPSRQLSPGISSNSSSLSSSPTLTTTSALHDPSSSSNNHHHSRSSRRHRSRSSKRRSTTTPENDGLQDEEVEVVEVEEDHWRPSPTRDHDSIAPVRVVHLGKNWQEIGNGQQSVGGGGGGGDLMVTPSTMRRQKRSGGGGGKGRPPSSHSMRTLPSRGGGNGGGGSNQPSPLRGYTTTREDGQLEPDQDEEQEEGEDEEESSRFGTAKSYRTAQSSGTGGGSRGSRMGLRDIWGTAIEDEQDGIDYKKREELEKALKQLEEEVESFKIKDVGPIVADLSEFKPLTK